MKEKKSVFLFFKIQKKADSNKKFVLSSGSCCFDRKSRSCRDCWASFFLDKTPCVCSRHGTAVNMPAVYLPHISLWLDYCCGTNILAGWIYLAVRKPVWEMMIAALFHVRVGYACFFLRSPFKQLAVAVIQACLHLVTLYTLRFCWSRFKYVSSR